MANSTSNLDLISSSQASKEVTANALFDAGSAATTYGRRASLTTALTWAYYGGNITLSDGTMSQIANGTLTLTASQTNYIVALKSSGAVSTSTATTNWNNTEVYWRLYSVVTGTATITSYTDYRQLGLFTGAYTYGALNYQGTWNANTNSPTLASGAGTKGDYYLVSVAGSTTLDGISTWTVGDIAAFNGSVWHKIEGGITSAEITAALGFTPADVAGKLSQFAATTSAELAGVISDETGSGALVFATSPALTTPALGTPASGDLRNCSLAVPPVIGGTTPAAATFTTLTGTSYAAFNGATGLTSYFGASAKPSSAGNFALGIYPFAKDTAGSLARLGSSLGSGSVETILSTEIVNFINGSAYSTVLKFYTRSTTTDICGFEVSGSGDITSHFGLWNNHPTLKIGYTTGAGGTVTQLTSKSTGVTLNTATGLITMNNASLAATTAVAFTLTNSAIAATDFIGVMVQGGFATANTYKARAEAAAAGSCTIIVENISGGSLSEAVTLRFVVSKSVNS